VCCLRETPYKFFILIFYIVCVFCHCLLQCNYVHLIRLYRHQCFVRESLTCFYSYQAIFWQSNTREHMCKFIVTLESTVCICLCTGCSNIWYSSCLQFFVNPLLVSIFMKINIIKNMFNVFTGQRYSYTWL